MTEPVKPSSLLKPFDWSSDEVINTLISVHCLQCMAERDITLDMVRKCLLNGYCHHGEDGNYTYCLPMDFYELRIVVSPDRAIVTAMYAPMLIDKLN